MITINQIEEDIFEFSDVGEIYVHYDGILTYKGKDFDLTDLEDEDAVIKALEQEFPDNKYKFIME